MKPIQLLQMLIFIGILTVFIGVSGYLPEVGDNQSPASTHVSPRYITEAYKETGAQNLVTAVLADYRGFDTLGETVVIFTAGAATILILRLFRKQD